MILALVIGYRAQCNATGVFAMPASPAESFARRGFFASRGPVMADTRRDRALIEHDVADCLARLRNARSYDDPSSEAALMEIFDELMDELADSYRVPAST